MTTKVTVDAHAGWPVRVTTRYKGQPDDAAQPVIVAPNTVQDFSVHSSADLFIEEIQPDEDDAA